MYQVHTVVHGDASKSTQTLYHILPTYSTYFWYSSIGQTPVLSAITLKSFPQCDVERVLTWSFTVAPGGRMNAEQPMDTQEPVGVVSQLPRLPPKGSDNCRERASSNSSSGRQQRWHRDKTEIGFMVGREWTREGGDQLNQPPSWGCLKQESAVINGDLCPVQLVCWTLLKPLFRTHVCLICKLKPFGW